MRGKLFQEPVCTAAFDPSRELTTGSSSDIINLVFVNTKQTSFLVFSNMNNENAFAVRQEELWIILISHGCIPCLPDGSGMYLYGIFVI